MNKPTTYIELAESLGLPWKDYIGLSKGKCKPINWIKSVCLKAAKEHLLASNTITYEYLDSLKTNKGGYTRATLERFKVSWPPEKGWRRKLIGQTIETD